MVLGLGAGPGRPSDAPASAKTGATFTAAGTYAIGLFVDDGQVQMHTATAQVTVAVHAENHPPVVRIATDPSPALVGLDGGTASAVLDGSASDDGNGGTQALTFAWSVLDGPATVAFGDPAAARTAATFTAAGHYRHPPRRAGRRLRPARDDGPGDGRGPAENGAPTARILRDPDGPVAHPGATARVTFDGSTSDDGDGGTASRAHVPWVPSPARPQSTFDHPRRRTPPPPSPAGDLRDRADRR